MTIVVTRTTNFDMRSTRERNTDSRPTPQATETAGAFNATQAPHAQRAPAVTDSNSHALLSVADRVAGPNLLPAPATTIFPDPLPVAVPGGEPSIPSSDAARVKSDGVRAIVGRADGMSALVERKSLQAAKNSQSMERGGVSASSAIYQAETEFHGQTPPPGVSRPLNATNAVTNGMTKFRAATYSSGWTVEQERELISLAAQGLSGAKIAARFPGKTRNAVIGKVHRLQKSGSAIALNGGAGGATPMREASKSQNRSRQQSKKNSREFDPGFTEKEVTIETPEHVEPLRLSLVDLTSSTCRWPLGDPKARDFSFCGLHTAHGRYCAYHSHLAYRPRERAVA